MCAGMQAEVKERAGENREREREKERMERYNKRRREEKPGLPAF